MRIHRYPQLIYTAPRFVIWAIFDIDYTWRHYATHLKWSRRYYAYEEEAEKKRDEWEAYRMAKLGYRLRSTANMQEVHDWQDGKKLYEKIPFDDRNLELDFTVDVNPPQKELFFTLTPE